MQGLENFLRLVFFDRLENFWFQLLPGQRLIRAGSRLTCTGSRLKTHAGSRLTCTGSHLTRVGSRLTCARSWLTCTGSHLNRVGSRLTCAGSRLVLEGVANRLKRVFAHLISQAIFIILICDSSVFDLKRKGVEQPISLKLTYADAHFRKQFLENNWHRIRIDRLFNLCLQFHPGNRLIHAGSRLVRRLLLRSEICHPTGLHVADATISAFWIVCRSRVALGYIIYPIAILVPRFSCVVRVFSFFLVLIPRIILVLVCLCPCNGNLTVRFRSILNCIGILIIHIRLLGLLLLLQFRSFRVHLFKLLKQLLQFLFILVRSKVIWLIYLLLLQSNYFRLTIHLLLHQCLNFRL